MAKYKVISKFDEVKIGGLKYIWKNASQEQLKDAYTMGFTDHVEKIEDKPEKKEGILKNPLSKNKKNEKEL